MNDKDWVLLTTLKEEKNITRAAERLFISQPALTYRIHQLERFFQSQLFIRNRSGLHFTPQGEIIVEYAQSMIKQLEETKEKIQSMEVAVKGTLKLGVSSIAARYMLPEMIRSFLNQYPGVDINVITGFSSEVEQFLVDGDIHIAIMRGDRHWDERKWLLSEESLLAASKEPITIENLPNLARIYYKTDSSLKALVDNWWKETFQKPVKITMAVDNLETCKEMVKKGLGYAILPGTCLNDEKDLYTYPLYYSDDHPVKRKTWVCCRNSSMNFAAVAAFFDFFKAYNHQTSK
ncbi:DNA-binding transcriptional LysR family regulator [Scopulibacillus darangshiensis]|uniref:DNA-binding transcriptional LysR family regulator n=1 Tax=Scopulibacillus darangshiensis TaxID=442528 RepID=A0A4R2NAB7_9BACL|nr:LysR family transcriptional regulator [Scopulibacillus darangshiensis]TCP17905.1 DNA-binding transcriptional LysR family regulator [Scopulibacillus darangshiensis]